MYQIGLLPHKMEYRATEWEQRGEERAIEGEQSNRGGAERKGENVSHFVYCRIKWKTEESTWGGGGGGGQRGKVSDKRTIYWNWW